MDSHNIDALVLCKRARQVETDTLYTVIGEAFVREEGSTERKWKPAVAWPGCSSPGAVIDLARSPFFHFSEAPFFDPDRRIFELHGLCMTS